MKLYPVIEEYIRDNRWIYLVILFFFYIQDARQKEIEHMLMQKDVSVKGSWRKNIIPKQMLNQTYVLVLYVAQSISISEFWQTL